MKKFTTFLLIVVVVLSVALAGCNAQTFCQHDFSQCDYLNLNCAKGCGAKTSRPASERNYDDKFVFTYNADKQTEVDTAYAALVGVIEAAEPYDATKHVYDADSKYYKANKDFEHNYFDKYTDLVDYITEQYQYAYVFYCQHDGANGTKANYEAISEARNNVVSDYYKLFRLIYNTQYREYFFCEEDGWSADDINVALNMSDTYGNQTYIDLNNEIDKFSTTYRDFTDKQLKSSAMENLYKQFVIKQNELAFLHGYADYVEYSYINVYERDYSPSDVTAMRKLVKNNLVSVFNRVYDQTRMSPVGGLMGYGSLYRNYNALCANNIFTDDNTLDYVAKYFATLVDDTVGKQKIDYYSAANDLFRNGNYYTGNYEGAFSYYIPAQNATILYFGPSSYSSAFTFVHEFGHYYNNIYNGNISLSMDHDETQSQGDEMLFLAFLKDYLGSSQSKLYSLVSSNQLVNMLATVLMSSAVDEFEQTVYKMTESELQQADLQALFDRILSGYGLYGIFDNNYWRYVVVDSPCYYISYAMSALPAMGIYATAMKSGYQTARNCYFKLYTFSEQPSLAHTDEQGNKIVDATYAEILHFAGLYGAFDTELYRLLDEQL